MVRRDCSWRYRLPGLFWSDGNQNGGNTHHLDFSLDNDTHAVTKGAASSKHYAISLRARDYHCHFWRGAFVQIPEKLSISHKTQVLITYAANNAFVGQFAQAVNGKNHIDIFIGVSVVVVFMCNHQLTCVYITRYEPPTIIAFQVEWLLVAQVDTCCCHERKYGFMQFAKMRRIGYTPL